MFALFPIVSNTLFGLLSVDAGHHDLFTLARLSRATRMTKLQLPAAVPSIVTGFRISAGLAVIGAVVGDTFFRQGKPGIGALIDVYRVRLQGEQMIGCIIMAVLLGLVVFIGVGTRWGPERPDRGTPPHVAEVCRWPNRGRPLTAVAKWIYDSPMKRVTLILAGAVGAAGVAASVVLPRVQQVPGPDLIEVAVPVVLIGCALVLAQRGQRWTAAMLGGSGMVWCVVGIASAWSGPLADGLLRLGVVPLAMVIVGVATLPGGAPTGASAATVMALVVAVSGGVGATTHVSVLLGALVMLSATHRLIATGLAATARSRLATMTVLLQMALGLVLVLVDSGLSASIIGPDVAADSVALALAAASLSVLHILNPELFVRGTTRPAPAPADRFGVESWLGDLLGAPHLRITYPNTPGGQVLENGELCMSCGGVPVASRDGHVVAWFDRNLVVDPALRVGLLRLLATVGASARLRAAQMERSAELARSRARLAEAALGESVVLERRLSLSVLPYLDAIERRASLLADPEGIRRRIDEARGQVLGVSRGLSPVSGGDLAAALGGLAAIAPDLVVVDLSAMDGPPSAWAPDIFEATAIWFAAAEAVANALKHAGGSKVQVRASGPCAVEVIDNGPGGADVASPGLAGIQDRLAAVGGHLEVSSDATGTSVSMWVHGRIRADAYPDAGLVTTTPSALLSYRG